MKIITFALLLLMSASALPLTKPHWYQGDHICPPPTDYANYSPPYDPLEHQYDFPDFSGADKPGWSCSYQRADGVMVQFGDSRTPRQQWFGVWGDSRY